jgi:hypothetical protein
MPSLDILAAIGLAAIGWIATVIVIRRSKLQERMQRFLMVPSWVPWIALALGAPAMHGVLPISNALSIGGAVTVGLLVPTLLSWISTR